MNETVDVVVSWPANSSVITSSRICSSRQRVAVLVLRVEQQAEDVLAALARRAALGDLRVDQRVELARGVLHARPRRAAHAKHAQEVVGGVERQRLLEQPGGVDRARAAAVGVQAEQRAHGHAHGQLARPRVQVEARRPATSVSSARVVSCTIVS